MNGVSRVETAEEGTVNSAVIPVVGGAETGSGADDNRMC